MDDSLISEIFGDERPPQGTHVNEYEADIDSEKELEIEDHGIAPPTRTIFISRRPVGTPF